MRPQLVLPQACPECGTWLQRQSRDPQAGVAPHFTACHPGVPIPVVAKEVDTG